MKRVAAIREPGRYLDGGGLLLQVSPSGGKSWTFRWKVADPARKDGFRQRMMGLGALADVSLEEARELAREARKSIASGRDPIADRRVARERAQAEAQRVLLFRDAAQAYFDAHEVKWANQKNRAQFLNSLRDHAFKELGGLPVSEITTADVLRALTATVENERSGAKGPFWHTMTEQARKVRSRIERVLAWATVHGFRQGDNPARWAGNLKEALPAPGDIVVDRHHPALPWREMPAFMAELANQGGMAALALRFLILTASRTSEVTGSTWDEIDLDAGVWVISKARMKAKREHRVALSADAVALLRAVPREDGNAFVFAGGRKGAPMSNMAMAVLLRRMERTGITVHGFRSSFRDWAGDHTEFPREVVEAALAHVVGDTTERAYRRSDALERRRVLMEAWASFCAGREAEGNVVAFAPGSGTGGAAA
ncbi:tyrosine-type recombinase/integrase [Xanthobacter variabilis]|uniref:tyrosine-type recombinase/integrase n=1 Tax=Xanthobacter variabilis TaxID=3119932 RepID=UPI00372940BB